MLEQRDDGLRRLGSNVVQIEHLFLRPSLVSYMKLAMRVYYVGLYKAPWQKSTNIFETSHTWPITDGGIEWDSNDADVEFMVRVRKALDMR